MGKSLGNLFTAVAGAFALIASLVVAVPASADTQNPVIVLDSGTVSSSTVSAGDQITVTWQVTDDVDCCDFNRINFVVDGDATNAVASFFDSPTRVSGDGVSGTYSKTFIVPSLANGSYELKAQVTDKTGKFSGLDRVARVTIGTKAPDTTKPSFNMDTVVISPASVARGESASVSVEVSDAGGCCESIVVRLVSTTGTSYPNVAMTRVSGSSTLGRYQASVPTSSSMVAGSHFVVVTARDTAGNEAPQSIGFLDVEPGSDTTKPIVQASSSFVSTSTSRGSDTVNFVSGGPFYAEVGVTDNSACCANVTVKFLNSNGGTIWSSVMNKVSGDSFSARYTLTTTINPGIFPATLRVVAVATDAAGNVSLEQQIGTAVIAAATTGDSKPPVVVLDSGVLSSSVVKVGDSVTATWQVTDDVGCCDFHRIHLIPKGGGTWDAISWYDSVTQVSGNATNGTYRRTFTMPQAAAGEYELWVWVTDKFGRYSTNTRVASLTVGAVADAQNPLVVLGSGTVSRSEVRAGEQLTVTWRVTDDLDCCDFNRINIMPQGASNADIKGFYDGAVRISGDGKSGVYSKTFTLPLSLTPRVYSLRAQATDKAGKYTRLDEVATFTVVSNVDTANPVVVPTSGVVFPSTSVPGGKVTLIYQVTDDLDCCNPHDAYLYDSLGNWVVRNQATLVSGTKTNGTYRVEMTLPKNLVSGRYTFKSQVTDKAGKYSQLQELGSVSVVAQDLQNPVIVPESAALSGTALRTGDVLTVSYQATDDVGCCNPHEAFVYDANNNLVLRETANRVSGDALRGTYRATFSLGESFTTGQYSVRTQVTDLAGKYSNLQLLGNFGFTSNAQQMLGIVRSTGLASPSIVQPGAIVRISFTVENDSGDVSARALIQDGSRTLASGTAIRLFRGVGVSQYYADVRVPSSSVAGNYVFAANVIDNKTGFSSSASFGTFVVQSQLSQLEAPRNIRFIDGGGLTPSSLIWDPPVAVSNNPVVSYTVQALSVDGAWLDFCSSDVSKRSCLLFSRTFQNKQIVAYRVAAVGNAGAGSYGSISVPASLTFVGDPIVSAANQPQLSVPGASLNIGTFNGKIVVYAKGMKGSTLTWKIAGKWQRAVVSKDFQLFDRKTTAIGLPVKVELFVNGGKPAAFSKTVVTK